MNRLSGSLNRGIIRSLQTGVISGSTDSTEDDVTVSAVNTAKSIVIVNGFVNTYSGIHPVSGTIRLKNATTVSAIAQCLAGTDTYDARYTLIEFW